MLNEFLLTKIEKEDIGNIWFQQDGATCHTDADKPDAINALNNNIREAIGEIQLHTIDNVLKNWTVHVGDCMASRSRHLNEIILHY